MLYYWFSLVDLPYPIPMLQMCMDIGYGQGYESEVSYFYDLPLFIFTNVIFTSFDIGRYSATGVARI